jgi:hypothetical protein
MNLTKLQNQTNEINPFIVELKGKMYIQPRANTIIAQGEAIIDKATGEVLENKGVLLGRRKFVDKSDFAKFYASEIGILFELSKNSINLILYFSKIMDYDNKVVFLPSKDYKKLDYKSANPCIFGIKELLKKDIIAIGRIYGEWWINPTIICKGERFAKYTEFVYDRNLDKEKDANLSLKNQIEYEENM